MSQMQVVADCCPIPGVVNGIDQSQLNSREFMLRARKVNCTKKHYPRSVEVLSVNKVTVEQGGETKTFAAVRVKINGDTPFYPASAFRPI